MTKLDKMNCEDFLSKVNNFDGANLNKVEFVLNPDKHENDYILIEVQLECSKTLCYLRMERLIKYRVSDMSGIDYLGMSGDPSSLVIMLKENSVLVSIGQILNGITEQNILNSNFFVEAESLEFELKN